MPIKRPRLALDDQAGSSTTARVSLTSLPIEILAEILLYTRSPPTVLAVSRTCSFLYHSLAQNPDASFIWRRVRKTCEPRPLPDPGVGWKKSEADYVAFVFGGGVCEVCQKATRAMYVSFSARIRLCGSWHCRKRFLNEFLVKLSSNSQERDPQYFWVPPVESTRCFYPSRLDALTWPRGEIWLRKSDWEEFQRELRACKGIEEAQSESEHATTSASLAVVAVEQCRVAIQRLPQIMEVAIQLIHWKWDYDERYEWIKRLNNMTAKSLAATEGWNLEDLVASQTFGSLLRRKTFLLEAIDLDDVATIQFVIESELLTLQSRHRRQKAEANYKEKLIEVKKIYERMRCGTLRVDGTGASDSSGPMILPPLSVFCTLPSICALKGSPDPSAVPSSSAPATSDINSPLAISLITADIHTWLIPVRKHLLTLLGYPNGWQSASAHTVPPLKRITARFFCRRCGEGKVGRGYQREQCLDFKGVCSHICVAAPVKSIEGQRQEAPEESDIEVAETGSGHGQNQGKRRGKKKSGSKTPEWTVDVFEKDEKAISLIKSIVNLTFLSEEHSNILNLTEQLSGCIRCITCKGWIVMDFDTAIGHAHRHESMQIRLLPWGDITYLLKQDTIAPSGNTSCPVPKSQYAFVRGTSELLLGPSRRARSLCKKVNYGCKHCIVVTDPSNAVVGSEKPKGPRAMSFNGLRSHVKEKHGIQDIRDEDFFCYTSIQSDGGQE